MKLKNNIIATLIDKQDDCLEQSSKKIKHTLLLELIESGNMNSVIKKLENKQEKLFKIYEAEWWSDNFFKKAKQWIEKVNLYLDHGGKAYLLESLWEFYYLYIVWLSLDNKKIVWQCGIPYQYKYKQVENRNENSDSIEKNINSLFALDIGKPRYNITD